jgi:hypothetical protein
MILKINIIIIIPKRKIEKKEITFFSLAFKFYAYFFYWNNKIII